MFPKPTDPSPHPAFTVATGEPDEAEALAAVAALTFPLACPDSLSREAIAAFTEENLSPSAFSAHLADPGTIVLLARDPAGDPVGYVVAIPGRGEDPAAGALARGRTPIYLSKCYAAPRAHGSGLATELMERTVELARSAGHDSLWLGTNADNARARRFYAKTGFLQRGERDFVVGGQLCRDVVLERPI